MKDNEFNFFRSALESDRDLFFGPLEGEGFAEIGEGWMMAHAAVAAGIFPSVSQARKNGFNRPIPSGFTDMRAGKKKTRITILNT